ncbi:MAG: ferritin [Akkermansiaceae bacterium]|nr:ferritin [Akkermansia sp.]MCD7797992.1 ferritin [Akkermansiaceae bacterium]MCD8070900.1 ferritin [Akkermansiaceae bacterium]
MKIKENILNALNGQIKAEFDSAFLYLSMAADMYKIGLDGIGHWLYVQYREEQDHALKIFNYLVQRGEKPELLALEQPVYEWEEPCDIFRLALEHEQFVTRSINELVSLAKSEEDYATDVFLHWYVMEQIEEERQVQDILDKIRMAGENGNGLLFIDDELSERKYEPIDQETD